MTKKASRAAMEKLQPICSDDPDKPRFGRPFRVGYRRKVWTAATDGYGAVMLHGDYGAAADICMDSLLNSEDRVSVAWSGNVWFVRRFAGPVVPHTRPCTDPEHKCGLCGGSKTQPCRCSCGNEHTVVCTCPADKAKCPSCNGTGFISTSMAVVRFVGILLDKHLLARFLSVVPNGRCEVRANGQVAPVWLEGNGWIVALMGIQPNGKETVEAEFPGSRLSAALRGADIGQEAAEP